MAVHPLAGLIEDMQARSDPPLSMREIARRSGVSPSRIREIMTSELRSLPDPDTLRGLADGLGVSLRTVVDAALASIGLPHGEIPTGNSTVAEMRHIVATSPTLRPSERDMWNDLINGLERRLRETGE